MTFRRNTFMTIGAILFAIFMTVSFSITSNAASTVDYNKDILKHQYSIKTTDRDRANDFIITFYQIAFDQQLYNEYTNYLIRTYGTYLNQDRSSSAIMQWATAEQKTNALIDAANNAIGLYNESIGNNPNIQKRYETPQIIEAVHLMEKMSFSGIKNAEFREFYEQGKPIFIQKFIDAGIIQSSGEMSPSNTPVDTLKTYAGNNAEFNAYNYYSRYPDLQNALGPNGDALLNHWKTAGKGEGRVAQ